MKDSQLLEMLFGVARSLAHTNRYSTVPVLRRETVAEHSFWVTFYAWTLARLLQKQHPELEINWGALMEQAAFHDMDEAVTGDFLRSVKYRLPRLKDLLNEVALLGMEEIDATLGANLKQAWLDSKGPGIEGAIVHTADYLGVVAYMSEETAMGNRILGLRAPDTIHYLRQWHEKLGSYPELPTPARDFLRDAVDAAIRAMTALVDGHAPELFAGLARVHRADRGA